MNDNKKPWDNEPAPLTDADELSQSESEGTEGLVSASHARALERRMLEAERLLEDSLWNLDGDVELKRKIKAHLEAARKNSSSNNKNEKTNQKRATNHEKQPIRKV